MVVYQTCKAALVVGYLRSEADCLWVLIYITVFGGKRPPLLGTIENDTWVTHW